MFILAASDLSCSSRDLHCITQHFSLWCTHSLLMAWPSVAVACGLSCSVASWSQLRPGIEPESLHCKTDSPPLDHQGSPHSSFFKCPHTTYLWELCWELLGSITFSVSLLHPSPWAFACGPGHVSPVPHSPSKASDLDFLSPPGPCFS